MYESFYAGILKHLRAIVAFTYPSPASYERVLDGYWAGGRWITWGDENREAPLRQCQKGHWELRTLDGMANPYLAMAAVLGAGIRGIQSGMPLRLKNCEVDPAGLTDAQRRELGIERMLPGDLGEALESLQVDEELSSVLNHAVVQRYIDVKKAEMALLEAMGEEERRQWLFARF